MPPTSTIIVCGLEFQAISTCLQGSFSHKKNRLVPAEPQDTIRCTGPIYIDMKRSSCLTVIIFIIIIVVVVIIIIIIIIIIRCE